MAERSTEGRNTGQSNERNKCAFFWGYANEPYCKRSGCGGTFSAHYGTPPLKKKRNTKA